MKLIFELPILVIILALAWQPIVQAQQSDASMLESNATVDLKQLRTMAEKGDPDAQFRLGELYEEGDIVDRDLDTAIESYRKAAEQGHVRRFGRTLLRRRSLRRHRRRVGYLRIFRS